MFSLRKLLHVPSADQSLPGRPTPIPTAEKHFVSGRPLKGPYPAGSEKALFGFGCFWGAEKAFWKIPGVWVTAVGYAAGHTPNPTYEEVCSGATGHNEVVLVVYDPKQVSYEQLLKAFFEAHDPTQGMRQGNDVGTQYRSGVYVYGAAQRRPRKPRSRPMTRHCKRSGSDRSRRKFSTRRNSTSPRTTISNILRRTRTATAGSEERASPARSVPGSPQADRAGGEHG